MKTAICTQVTKSSSSVKISNEDPIGTKTGVSSDFSERSVNNSDKTERYDDLGRAAVAQWLGLELRCERSQVRSNYMSFRLGRNLALHHAYALALCWCLVSSSCVYWILSTLNY